MNKNNRSQRNRNQPAIQHKLTRCSQVMRPVWDDETCSKFSAKTNATTAKTCKECKYSLIETK